MATKTAAKAATNGSADPTVGVQEIHRIQTETMLVPVVGLSELIVHNFSEKAKRQMLDKMQGRRAPKEIRDPKAEYLASFYRLPGDRFGFPVTAFKAATVGAARYYGPDVKMTELRQFVFFHGETSPLDPQALVQIVGDPHMREDVVRLAGPSRPTDLRYRPGFWPWSATLRVTYVNSSLSRGSVLSLIDAGGMGSGVGEWRTEKRGTNGTYQIDPNVPVLIERDGEVVEA